MAKEDILRVKMSLTNWKGENRYYTDTATQKGFLTLIIHPTVLLIILPEFAIKKEMFLP